MPSQHGEDRIIAKFFGDKCDGKFLDVGAYDGKTFSNTHALYERGWSGVCVEGGVSVFPGLARLYGKSKRVKLLNAVIGEAPGIQLFHDTPDAVGSLNQEHYEKWKGTVPFTDFYVSVINMDMVLREFQGPYDFVSIDIEGLSIVALRGLVRFARPTLICVEVSEQEKLIVKNILTPKGYKHVDETAENVLYAI